MTPVGDLLSTALSPELERRVRCRRVLKRWPQLVGAEIANASQPQSFRGSTLFVTTSSAVWSNELTLLKPQIMAKLNAALGEALVQDIVFRAGLPKRSQPADARECPGVALPSPQTEPLTRPERELVGSLLTDLEEPRLRQAVRSCAEESLRLRKARRKAGWRECGACGRQNRPAAEQCGGCGRLVVLSDRKRPVKRKSTRRRGVGSDA
jgi:predicted nucleic acid-binding Zn ribbon protein